MTSPRIVHGTTNLYGFTVGILMIEGRFPRIHGAIGHAQTFAFPVHHKIVRGANGTQTVRELARLDRDDPRYTQIVAPWLCAARELEREGVHAIATSCGFAALIQHDLVAAVEVPVLASGLLLVPLIKRMLKPDRKVGIITADARALSERHLAAAGIAPDTVAIAGLEHSSEFERMAYDEVSTVDFGALERDVVARAHALDTPDNAVGALLIECSLLLPFSATLQACLSKPVFDIRNLVSTMHASTLNFS